MIIFFLLCSVFVGSKNVKITTKKYINIMHSTDHETGEVTLTKQYMKMIDIDMETGEMDSNISSTMPMMRKTTFIVPKELYQTRRNKKKKLRCIDSVDNYTLFKKEEVINLHEVNSYIIYEANRLSFCNFMFRISYTHRK